MSPENHKKLFGIDKELVCLTKGLIIYDTTYYTDMPLDKLLLKIGTHYKTEAQHKDVCAMDAGWNDNIWYNILKDNVVIPYSAIKGMKVKPIYEFRNDFPYFDNKAYTKFYKELDEYFADMPKAGVYMTPEDYPKTIDECKGDKEPFPEKFMKVIDLEEVKKKEPVATFKCLNGYLCPVDEEVPIMWWKYERQTTIIGGEHVASGATLWITPREDYAGKVQSAFVKWRDLCVEEVPKSSVVDDLTITDYLGDMEIKYLNVLPVSYNLDTNTFELHADWVK